MSNWVFVEMQPDLVLFTGMFSSPFLFINLILLGACIFVFFSDGFILFAPMPLGDVSICLGLSAAEWIHLPSNLIGWLLGKY